MAGSLHVRAYGPPNTTTPTLVFIPGGGLGGWMWQAVIDELDQEYHCLAPDPPEHGESTLAAAGPYSIAATAEDIAGLIAERAHGGRAHVIGLSLGAQTVVQLLATRSEVLRRAFVTGTLLRGSPGMGLLNAALRLYLPFKNLTPFMEANRRGLRVPERHRLDFFEDTQRTTRAGLTRILAENQRFRLPPNLASVQTPTLVVVGEQEPEVMRQSAWDLVHALPNAQGHIAVGQPHAWPLTDPHLFAATVHAWVEDEPLPTPLVPLF